MRGWGMLGQGDGSVPRRARGTANDRALRQAAEESDAEPRRADFDLTVTIDSEEGNNAPS